MIIKTYGENDRLASIGEEEIGEYQASFDLVIKLTLIAWIILRIRRMLGIIIKGSEYADQFKRVQRFVVKLKLVEYLNTLTKQKYMHIDDWDAYCGDTKLKFWVSPDPEQELIRVNRKIMSSMCDFIDLLTQSDLYNGAEAREKDGYLL